MIRDLIHGPPGPPGGDNARISGVAVRAKRKAYLNIGLINSFGNIGGFVGPYLIGFLKDLTGSHTPGWIYLACSMICSGLLMLTFKQKFPTGLDGVTTSTPKTRSPEMDKGA